MMISPEFYYEEYLKGKTKEEIETAIDDLKSEMERLIDLKESGETSSEALMQPSPEVRIKENRNYLEEAKKALAEVGGNYQPTEREMLSEDFDQHVDFLKRIVYSRHGFSFGNVTYTIDIMKDAARMETEIVPSFGEVVKDAYGIDKEYLIDQILVTHVGEWKSEYDNYNILDGESWELEFIFADKYKKKQWQGANAWPWNWDDLLEALQIKEDGCNGNCIDNWWK